MSNIIEYLKHPLHEKMKLLLECDVELKQLDRELITLSIENPKSDNRIILESFPESEITIKHINNTIELQYNKNLYEVIIVAPFKNLY